jgi:hypothetical protein
MSSPLPSVAVKACLAVGVLGTLLLFLGDIVTQSAVVSDSSSNPVGLAWYFCFYSIALYGSLVVTHMKGVTEQYRMALLAFMAAYLGSIPDAIYKSLLYTNAIFGTVATGSGMLAAGFLMTILPMFILVIILGSDVDSAANLVFIMLDDTAREGKDIGFLGPTPVHHPTPPLTPLPAIVVHGGMSPMGGLTETVEMTHRVPQHYPTPAEPERSMESPKIIKALFACIS